MYAVESHCTEHSNGILKIPARFCAISVLFSVCGHIRLQFPIGTSFCQFGYMCDRMQAMQEDNIDRGTSETWII